jgi:hypothetical protein
LSNIPLFSSRQTRKSLSKGVILMKHPDQTRDAAESSFKKKERRLSEGRKAMAEHDAAARSVDANTARLRALRLARDAAESAAPAKAAKASPVKKKKKKIAAASPTVAAVIASDGDKEQSLQMQSDRLKMAAGDGARVPNVQKIPHRIKTPIE